MDNKTLLVGDNPFHGVSHFSQEKARVRNAKILEPAGAAEIVQTSFDNGADGFMFSVSETTLEIIRLLPPSTRKINYYAIVPAAGDYVRMSSKVGTVGLVKYVAAQTIQSGNIAAIANGVRGIVLSEMPALFKAYLGYEIARTNRSLHKKGKLDCLMLHELITEMAVALNMDWLIRTHVQYLKKRRIKPGFETRNFAPLVKKLEELNIDTNGIVITAPFNQLGYQMNPSREECEKALKTIPDAEVIAMSVLASGKLTLKEANEYLKDLTGLKGYVIGVSRKEQAEQTFGFFKRNGG